MCFDYFQSASHLISLKLNSDMKIYTILFFLVLNFFGYSQTLKIDYERTINAKRVLFSTNETFKMILSKSKSIFYGVSDDSTKYEHKKFIESIKKIGVVRLIQFDDANFGYSFNELLYKDYSQDTLFFNDLILNKMVYVGERIDKMNWVLKSDTKKMILGKECVAAKTTFRGRSYTALFTTNLDGFTTGPWKFDGLPGVILSVKSDDGYVSFQATKLSLENKDTEVINPYKKTNKIISWEAFKKQFKNTLVNALKRMKSLSEDGESGSIEFNGDRIEDIEFRKIKY